MKINILLLTVIACVLSCRPVTAQEQRPAASPQQTTGGGTRAIESPFRVVRSVSGTKLIEQSGRIAVEDPRTTFFAPQDKQIIVYFTWEGPVGKHHFEGLWKNPNGKVVMISDFDYASDQPRFGGYFKMFPGETPVTGIWTLEARINGETAGSHNFQISIGAGSDNLTNVSTRRVLNPSELYSRAAAASVVIENINQKGARRNVGTGFFIGPDRLLTAFQVIDDATKVRVVGPQNRLVEVTEVISWNRRQDWIILKVALEGIPTLSRASAGSWAIGDRSYFLDVPAEGSRVLIETSLTGKQNFGAVGERLNIGESANRRAAGSPVLNDYGEVIGLVGGSLVPGAAFLEDLAFSARSLALPSRGTLAVPINLVEESLTNFTTIQGLASTGQFVPALVTSQAVLSGTLARAINKKSNPPQVVDQRYEFSRANPQGVLFLTWLPEEKRKGKPSLRLYDLDNRLIAEYINKKKITVTPTKLSYSLWELNFPDLPSGIYRLDVVLNEEFVWRTFFRMVE